MAIYYFVPVLIGLTSVIQIGLNKVLGQQYGLAMALIVNAVMIMVMAVGLWVSTYIWPERFSTFIAGSGGELAFKWWYIFPGIFGFLVISGLPYCMNRIGALAVFIFFVTAQVVASMLWDSLIDGLPITLGKIAGALIALVGVILVSVS